MRAFFRQDDVAAARASLRIARFARSIAAPDFAQKPSRAIVMEWKGDDRCSSGLPG
jgi:hypothetical protein